MTAEYVRDAAMTGVVFAFFAAGWFGWAQDEPPARWRRPLVVGSVLSVLTCAACGLLAWRQWGTGSVFDAELGPRFGVLVAVEVALAGLGAVVLTRRGATAWVPVWIAGVVGVHFLPLASLLGQALVLVVGVLVTAVAAATPALSRRWSVAPSAVVGAGTGTVLLAGALVSLADAATRA